MANVLYLGQSILRTFTVKRKGVDVEEVIPAIYLGKNSEQKPVIVINSKDYDDSLAVGVQRFNLNDELKSCDFVREKDTKSPTGKRIYFGGLTRKFMGDALLKSPDTEAILKEITNIKKVKV